MNVLFSVILLAQNAFAPLFNAPQWIGSRPPAASYTGKVVIVDIFTFDCINCKHIVPELRSLRAHYPTKDVLIVGIHTPETPFERIRANVVQALATQGISWPIAIDNDEKLWNAYRRAILADAADLRSSRTPQKDGHRRGPGCRSHLNGRSSSHRAMISLALAATLTSMQGTLAYRVAVRGPVGSSVIVAAEPPPGWTAAFCSPRLCAVGHVPIIIAAAGISYLDLHLYSASRPMHGTAVVTARGTTLRLRV